jgi:hypothetical protein
MQIWASTRYVFSFSFVHFWDVPPFMFAMFNFSNHLPQSLSSLSLSLRVTVPLWKGFLICLEDALQDFRTVQKLLPRDQDAATKVKECEKIIRFSLYIAVINHIPFFFLSFLSHSRKTKGVRRSDRRAAREADQRAGR